LNEWPLWLRVGYWPRSYLLRMSGSGAVDFFSWCGVFAMGHILTIANFNEGSRDWRWHKIAQNTLDCCSQ